MKSKNDIFVNGIIRSLSASKSNNLTFLDTDLTPLPNNSVYVIEQPGYVVHSPTQLHMFRDDTVRLILSRRVTSCSSVIRIGILNRTRNRRLENVDALINGIKQALPIQQQLKSLTLRMLHLRIKSTFIAQWTY